MRRRICPALGSSRSLLPVPLTPFPEPSCPGKVSSPAQNDPGHTPISIDSAAWLICRNIHPTAGQAEAEAPFSSLVTQELRERWVLVRSHTAGDGQTALRASALSSASGSAIVSVMGPEGRGPACLPQLCHSQFRRIGGPGQGSGGGSLLDGLVWGGLSEGLS